MNKEQRYTNKLVWCRHALMIALLALPIFLFAETDKIVLKLNEPFKYKGLTLTLLDKTEYNPMVGTSAFLKANYKDREDIIGIGLAACEPDLDAICQWQGFHLKLPYPIENYSTNSLTLVISKEKGTSVEKVFNQENLQKAYNRLKQEMNIVENQPGNVSGVKVKSESMSLFLEYQHGKVRHVYDWQEFIVEEIQVNGEMFKQGHYSYGFTYRLLKSDNGEIIIYSGAIDKNEKGVVASLNFLLDKSVN